MPQGVEQTQEGRLGRKPLALLELAYKAHVDVGSPGQLVLGPPSGEAKPAGGATERGCGSELLVAPGRPDGDHSPNQRLELRDPAVVAHPSALSVFRRAVRPAEQASRPGE